MAANKRARPVLPHLPIELITNILAKLPAKSILLFKLVCKEWRDIITGQRFAQVYDQESHVVCCFKTRGSSKAMYMIESYQGVKGQSFKSLTWNCCYPAVSVQLAESSGGTLDLCPDLEVGNSCRGFLLIIGEGIIHSTQDCCRIIFIYNPLTKEHTAPINHGPAGRRGDVKLVVSGLGYSPSTKQYKVVSFFRRQGGYVIEVQTIGTDHKRRIHGRKSILDKIRPENNPSLALNGSLHWLATGEQIARFDIDREEFSLMASPCLGDSGKYVISIGMLHGFLCVNIIEPGNTRHGVESWVMKEYGIAESWTRFCVVKNLESELTKPTQELSRYRIWESGDKGKVLVLTPSGTVLSYDLHLQQCLPVRGLSFANSMKDKFLHSPGFFSLPSTGTKTKTGESHESASSFFNIKNYINTRIYNGNYLTTSKQTFPAGD